MLGDLFPGFLSWGYTFGLIALAAMVGRAAHPRSSAARAADRMAAGRARGGGESAAPVAGRGADPARDRRRAGRPGGRCRYARGVRAGGPTIGLTGAPLLYYVILGRADLSLASGARGQQALVLAGVDPDRDRAADAARRCSRTAGGPRRSSRRPPAPGRSLAFGVYFLSGTGRSATPLHAFQGITFPLAVLAIEGLQMHPLGAVGAAALVVGPCSRWPRFRRRATSSTTPPSWRPRPRQRATSSPRDERDALKYLAKSPEPGGVITQGYLGALVPGHHRAPDPARRLPVVRARLHGRGVVAGKLFEGAERAIGEPAAARTKATLVLADCKAKGDLTASSASTSCP